MLKAILQIRRVLLGSFVILFIYQGKRYTHMPHCPCVGQRKTFQHWSSPSLRGYCGSNSDCPAWLHVFYFQKKGFERIILPAMVANT